MTDAPRSRFRLPAFLLTTFGIASAGLFFASSGLRADVSDGRLEVYWTDVEGGAATLIVTPAGETILFDTGLPGERDPYRIERTVRQFTKKERIDHLIVTHFDVDHFGGAADLSKRIEITKVWDPGIPELEGRRKGMIQDYRRAFRGKRKVLKPGDAIPLKQGAGEKVSIRCLAAARKYIDPAEGAKKNELCETYTETRKRDGSQNGESTAFIIEFGAWRFLNCGDLTWNLERRLVCPVNLVGDPVDVFQVNHHGLDSSNHPALIRSVQPRVAVFNNGTRKGCQPKTFKTVSETKSIQAIFQMHKNLRKDSENNTKPERIANHEKDCGADIIRLSVARDTKSYDVAIPSTKHSETFKTRKQ